jgi:hypothetical protein
LPVPDATPTLDKSKYSWQCATPIWYSWQCSANKHNTSLTFITGKEIHFVPSLPKQRALYVTIGKQLCAEPLRSQGVKTVTQFARSSVIHYVLFSNEKYPFKHFERGITNWQLKRESQFILAYKIEQGDRIQ